MYESPLLSIFTKQLLAPLWVQTEAGWLCLLYIKIPPAIHHLLPSTHHDKQTVKQHHLQTSPKKGMWAPGLNDQETSEDLYNIPDQGRIQHTHLDLGKRPCYCRVTLTCYWTTSRWTGREFLYISTSVQQSSPLLDTGLLKLLSVWPWTGFRYVLWMDL